MFAPCSLLQGFCLEKQHRVTAGHHVSKTSNFDVLDTSRSVVLGGATCAPDLQFFKPAVTKTAREGLLSTPLVRRSHSPSNGIMNHRVLSPSLSPCSLSLVSQSRSTSVLDHDGNEKLLVLQLESPSSPPQELGRKGRAGPDRTNPIYIYILFLLLQAPGLYLARSILFS